MANRMTGRSVWWLLTVACASVWARETNRPSGSSHFVIAPSFSCVRDDGDAYATFTAFHGHVVPRLVLPEENELQWYMHDAPIGAPVNKALWFMQGRQVSVAVLVPADLVAVSATHAFRVQWTSRREVAVWDLARLSTVPCTAVQLAAIEQSPMVNVVGMEWWEAVREAVASSAVPVGP